MRTEIALKCLDGKHRSARPGAYAGDMAKTDAVLTIADNLRTLMGARKESQQALANRAGVSQRVVGDILTYGRGHFKNPTIRTIDLIADAYSMPVWALMIPNVAADPTVGTRLTKLISSYVAASSEGRASIDRIAEGEARFAALADGKPAAMAKTGS